MQRFSRPHAQPMRGISGACVACRKRDVRKPDATAIAQLPPPLQAQDPDMLFAALPDPSRLPQGEFNLPPTIDRRRVRARIGRGGTSRTSHSATPSSAIGAVAHLFLSYREQFLCHVEIHCTAQSCWLTASCRIAHVPLRLVCT